MSRNGSLKSNLSETLATGHFDSVGKFCAASRFLGHDHSESFDLAQAEQDVLAKTLFCKTLRLMIFRREICKRLGDFGLCTALPMSREHFDIGQTLKWTVWNGLF